MSTILREADALSHARDWLRKRWGQEHPNEGHVRQLAEYAAALSSERQESGEPLTPEQAWDDLINKDDRTSPEEYPDHALITFDELAAYMRATPSQESGEPIGYLRPEVLAFAHLMEQQLRANDHKPGWKNDDADVLARRVIEEADELLAEAISYECGNRPTNAGAEAADVANMAMMVADVCGFLKATPSQESGEREGWQPIETAPKNGTPVILGVAGNEFYPRSGWWDSDFERWVVRVSMDGESATGLGIEPTHWQPLPPPPSPSLNSGGQNG